MLVSTSHKFFFIAAPKSASTSITKALRPVLDVPKRLRDGRSSKPVVELHHNGMLHSPLRWPGNQEILEKHPDFTRAGTCRNPWWRMIAIYYQVALGVDGQPPRNPVPYPAEPFDMCVLRLCDRKAKARGLWGGMDPRTLQSFWLNGCTHLLRFETLQPDFEIFCTLQQIPARPLPWIMRPTYRGERPWQDWYDKETSDAVGELWGDDADCYGYEAPI